MPVCGQCGQENPEIARFCLACGAALAAAAAQAREERKVVSVLFADLVGFTARAERLDPEDVRRFLSPYYARLRTELERFGGTVEKFIGDAVMALFGAPIAHEDDPERAVRAALSIRDAILPETELQLRIAVTTGEALVTLGARITEGEGMASGDVVNTASRLQNAAPVNGILVDEPTYRATSQVIRYEAAEPVAVKGKEEPVRVWQAVATRSRLGVDLFDRARSPLVGRESELDAVRDALRRAREQRTAQLVTLVGVPGIGKSRLVHELMETVRESDELHYWRQGRSLPYGAGVAFWALSEIVKAQAGISEDDAPEEAERKLDEAVRETIPSDAEWIAGHLRPLLGLGGEAELGEDRRIEAFAAWRRFFEALAEHRPLVLVFEDLQWADDASLDFVDHLVDWSSDVPLLVACTARPELLERRPGWGGGKRNAVTVSLDRLSDDETAALLGRLLDRAVLPAETQQALLLRAGGNPLYAEQYARMLEERPDGESLPLPENVQGIIAARIDGLSPEEKELLQDAAVMGKVFWAGSVADGSSPWELDERLHALERKDFVQRARRSSIDGETEYSFRHVLVRDVAYGQIPRRERAGKHVAAAEWIEALGRPADHAELLAYHYAAALDLAEAAGAEPSTLVAAARNAFRAAGERALSLLALEPARDHFTRALELTAADDPARPGLLLGLATAKHEAGDDDRIIALEAARDALLSAGDRERAAVAEGTLAEASWLAGGGAGVLDHVTRALELAEGLPASVPVATVLARAARYLTLAGRKEEGFELAQRVVELATELGSLELRVHGLNTQGIVFLWRADERAGEYLREAAELVEQSNSPQASSVYNNLAIFLMDTGLELGMEMGARARDAAARLGQRAQVRFQDGLLVANSYLRGDWQRSLELAEEFIRECETGSPHYQESVVRGIRAQIRVGRGDAEGAIADAERAVEVARDVPDPQRVGPAVTQLAYVLNELGRKEQARPFARETVEIAKAVPALPMLVEPAWFAADLGVEEEQRALLETLPASPWRDGALAVLNGDFERAAALYEQAGADFAAALARLHGAEAAARSGDQPAARRLADRALPLLQAIGATAYLRRAESLLAATA
jgi:class 3 adenylate cyclase/tetratricopeptide (TPR) repeat protein